MADFKPFSLAESIQSGQRMRMNQLKLQQAEAGIARQGRLRGLAEMSQRPVYGEAEGPPLNGVRPQIQTGTEYDPMLHMKQLQSLGETEMATALEQHISQMGATERKDTKFKLEQASKEAIAADSPEKWDALMVKMAKEHTEFKQIPFENREEMINQARSIEDILKKDEVLAPKAPKTRNIRQGKEIVNQEWDEKTGAWREVGRGPISQQQINLRNKPSEQAAGKDFQDILSEARIAEDQIFTIHKAKALLPGIDTGKLEPLKNWAKEWSAAFGVYIDTEKMSDSVSFKAVMKGAVLDGMKAIKGTASEADRKTVEDAVASFDKPENANKFLLNTAESLSRRKIEQANFWDKWAESHDASLLGARRAWSKRMADIPLIRKVKGRYYHYYKFKELAMKANKKAFAGASPEEIETELDRMWNAN